MNKKRLMAEVRHERELRQLSERYVKKALKVQAREYERRLGTLNHAHEQAVAEQARTLPRADFETYKETTRREEDLAKKAQDLVHEKQSSDIRAVTGTVDRFGASFGTIRAILAFVGFSGLVALGGVIYVLVSGNHAS